MWLKLADLRLYQREKEQDLTRSYDENPYTNWKFNNQLTTQKRHQNNDYTTIADRLMTVSWSNNSRSTGVVKSGLNGTNLPTYRKRSVINRTWHGRNIFFKYKQTFTKIDTC